MAEVLRAGHLPQEGGGPPAGALLHPRRRVRRRPPAPPQRHVHLDGQDRPLRREYRLRFIAHLQLQGDAPHDRGRVQLDGRPRGRVQPRPEQAHGRRRLLRRLVCTVPPGPCNEPETPRVPRHSGPQGEAHRRVPQLRHVRPAENAPHASGGPGLRRPHVRHHRLRQADLRAVPGPGAHQPHQLREQGLPAHPVPHVRQVGRPLLRPDPEPHETAG